MIVQRTFLVNLELDFLTKRVGVKLGLFFVDITDDGDVVKETRWHRTNIGADEDAAGTMALVNTHLESMGWPAASEAVVAEVCAEVQRMKTRA